MRSGLVVLLLAAPVFVGCLDFGFNEPGPAGNSPYTGPVDAFDVDAKPSLTAPVEVHGDAYWSSTSPSNGTVQAVDGETSYRVALEEPADDTFLSWMAAEGIEVGYTSSHLPVAFVVASPDQYEVLLDRPEVLWIEPDIEQPISNYASGTKTRVHGGTLHDPGLRLIKEGHTGDGMVIAIVDTGIDDEHPCFSDGQIVGHAQVSWFGGIREKNGVDRNGHGTHAACTAAGGGRGDRGGVAPGAFIIEIKVPSIEVKFPEQKVVTSRNAVQSALTWIYDNKDRHWGGFAKGIDVVSLSVGGGHYGPYHDDTAEVRQLTANGIVVVAAMGNSNQNKIPWTAAAPHAIAVGGSDGQVSRTQAPTPWVWEPGEDGTNFGPSKGGDSPAHRKPTVLAPAVDVYSARAGGSDMIPKSGTSFATPQVAGIAALMIRANVLLGPADVKQILEETARPVAGDCGNNIGSWTPICGYGQADAFAAVQRAYADRRDWPERLATFEVMPDEILIGEPTTLSANVEDVDGTASIFWKWNGDERLSDSITVSPESDDILKGTVGSWDNALRRVEVPFEIPVMKEEPVDDAEGLRPPKGRDSPGHDEDDFDNDDDDLDNDDDGGSEPPTSTPSYWFDVQVRQHEGGLYAHEVAEFVAVGADEAAVSWTFSDGTINDGQSIEHAFPEPGEYWLEVEATWPDGHQESDALDLTVLANSVGGVRKVDPTGPEAAQDAGESIDYLVECFADPDGDSIVAWGLSSDARKGHLGSHLGPYTFEYPFQRDEPGEYRFEVYCQDENGGRTDSVDWIITVRERPPPNRTVASNAIKSPDGGHNTAFGTSLAVDGAWLAVGAPGHSYPSEEAGAVYLYHQIDGDWERVMNVTAQDPSDQDWFGYDVTMNDGWLFVGAPGDDDNGGNAGAVHVFKRIENAWQFADILIDDRQAPGVQLGRALDTSGNLLVVGGHNHGAVLDDFQEESHQRIGRALVYKENGGQWDLTQRIQAPSPESNDGFGNAVAAGENHVAITAHPNAYYSDQAPRVYAYSVADDELVFDQGLLPQDGANDFSFGRHLAAEGNRFFIHGQPSTSAMYRAGTGEWVFEAGVTLEVEPQWNSDAFIEGDSLFVGAPDVDEYHGKAWRLELNDGGWEVVEEYQSSDGVAYDIFGAAIVATPNQVIVGAPMDHQFNNNMDSGAVYVFDRSEA